MVFVCFLEAAMDMTRICDLKRWLVLHLTAWILLRSCSAAEPHGTPGAIGMLSDQAIAQPTSGIGDPPIGGSWLTEDERWREFFGLRYFYVHNESQVAMARADAEAATAATTQRSSLSSGTFPDFSPDFSPSMSGCFWDSADRILSFRGSDILGFSSSTTSIQILAVESCAGSRNVFFTSSGNFEFCSQRWEKPEKPDIRIRENPDPLTRSFNVLVLIQVPRERPPWGFEVLADGVYFPATGKMHLVGCAWKPPPIADWMKFSRNSSMAYNYVPAFLVPEKKSRRRKVWINSDTRHESPLNSSTPEDCAIVVTVQYPPLNCRWNRDRVVKYSIHSKREKDDLLYFEPIERTIFNPYQDYHFRSGHNAGNIEVQRRLETWGRIVLLVLGLVCVALQIEHGRSNEESLPFVSLAMLGIQLANHLSQTSIFKDFQIGGYQGGYRYTDSAVKYYGLMALSEHVSYQAMTMAAIFMYVWIFHRVSDRRRIMKLRVCKKRPGAKEPPSEWRVVYATVAFFSMLCLLGFLAIEADQGSHIWSALTEMTVHDDRFYYARRAAHNVSGELPFVSWLSYERWQAHWGFINKLTGLVVSFFLVPQVLGNARWEVEGRPLSAWFYIGIPFLQSLPHVANIAKHFQLLPIFSFWDPYVNSIYGIYEDLTPWWQIGVVVCSTLQVLAVHSQFSVVQ